jgi:hypothetical protein
VLNRSASIGRGAAMLVAVGAAVTIFATPAFAGTSRSDHGQRPPGNNGTIKIDEFPADGGKGNDPHVGCRFSVNFFGYDAGTQQATMTFEPWAPTSGGNPTTMSTSWTTPSRKGGNQLDKSFGPVDLTSAFAGITPAKQGYHVKLTVHVTGSQGSDVKHKVFWVEPCQTAAKPAAVAPAHTTQPVTPASPQPQPVRTSAPLPAAQPEAVQPAALQPVAAPSAPAVEAARFTNATQATPVASVLAERISAPPTAAAVEATSASGGTLPFTGGAVGTLVAAGISLLVLGGLAWLSVRWKSHRA